MREIVCINEGVYSGALTRGTHYSALAEDADKRQVKVRGDNGRVRWFPGYCFDLEGREPPTMVSMTLRDDPEDTETSAVEVDIELSSGERRWCWFATPTGIAEDVQTRLEGGDLLQYGAPHVIVVSALSKAVIEQALDYIERQNTLLDCTRSIECGEAKENVAR